MMMLLLLTAAYAQDDYPQIEATRTTLVNGRPGTRPTPPVDSPAITTFSTPFPVRWVFPGARLEQGTFYATEAVGGIAVGQELRTSEQVEAYLATSIMWEAPYFKLPVVDSNIGGGGTITVCYRDPETNQGKKGCLEVDYAHTQDLSCSLEIVGWNQGHGIYRVDCETPFPGSLFWTLEWASLAGPRQTLAGTEVLEEGGGSFQIVLPEDRCNPGTTRQRQVSFTAVQHIAGVGTSINAIPVAGLSDTEGAPLPPPECEDIERRRSSRGLPGMGPSEAHRFQVKGGVFMKSHLDTSWLPDSDMASYPAIYLPYVDWSFQRKSYSLGFELWMFLGIPPNADIDGVEWTMAPTVDFGTGLNYAFFPPKTPFRLLVGAGPTFSIAEARGSSDEGDSPDSLGGLRAGAYTKAGLGIRLGPFAIGTGAQVAILPFGPSTDNISYGGWYATFGGRF